MIKSRAFQTGGRDPARGRVTTFMGRREYTNFTQKYCICYSYELSVKLVYSLRPLKVTLYAVLFVELVYSLRPLRVVKNWWNCAKHNS